MMRSVESVSEKATTITQWEAKILLWKKTRRVCFADIKMKTGKEHVCCIKEQEE